MTKDLNTQAYGWGGGIPIQTTTVWELYSHNFIFVFYISFAVLEMEAKALPNCLPVPN